MARETLVALGLMSGTSLDGLDLCLVEFNADDLADFSILAAETRPYEADWNERLKRAFASTLVGGEELKELDQAYGELLGKQSSRFIKERSKGRKVDLIASHGHTIFHKPDQGVTVQIGSGERIHQQAKIPVVCNFRVQDVSLGGQGAPLVPVGDRLLFTSYHVCLNLGGIANLSFEKRDKLDDESARVAWDICPVNLVLNHFAAKLGLAFDDGGQMARKGKIHRGLYDRLNQLAFYQKAPPKSLGYEFVVESVFPLVEEFQVADVHDILRTLTEHIAYQIAQTLNATGKSNVLVTGGGAYNAYLIERLQEHSNLDVCVPADPMIVEYKEALIFALLGVLKVQGRNNCLSSVTGAQRDHCSGDCWGFL